MESDDRKRIQANYVLLVRDLNVDGMLPVLKQNSILSDEDMDILSLKGTSKQQNCRRLLAIIVKKNTQNIHCSSFQVFCTAIKNQNQDYIVQAMINTKIIKLPDDDREKEERTNTAADSIDDRKRIHANRQYVANNVIVESIIDHLYQFGALNDEDMEKISPDRNTTPQTRCRRLLTIIRRKGAYHFFYKALKINGYGWLVDKLMATDISQIDLADEPDAGMQSSHELCLVQLVKDVEEKVKEREKRKRDHDQAFMIKPKPPKEMKADDSEEIAKSVGIYLVKYMNNPSKYDQPTDKYHVLMKKLSNELSKKHDQEFHNMTKKLQGCHGFQALKGVADSVFSAGVTWGRIVTLYAFCGYLGKYIVNDSESKVASDIGEYIGEYVSKNCGKWIAQNGGWDACMKKFNP